MSVCFSSTVRTARSIRLKCVEVTPEPPTKLTFFTEKMSNKCFQKIKLNILQICNKEGITSKQ